MSLVNAKCTNCGGILEVDNTKDAMMCKFCGSAFIVEKAIQNFNITNVTNNHIETQIVHVHAPEKSDFEVHNNILVGYSGTSRIVTVPDGVIEIGESAFEDCKHIQEVILPTTVSVIGKKAFYNCIRLKKVNLSEGLTTISESAFFKCENLSDMILPDSVKNIGESAFQGCTAFDFKKLPENLRTVNPYTFAGCGVKSLTVNKLTSIEKFAFSNCNSLTQCVIDCAYIEESAFKDCKNLSQVTFVRTQSIKKSAFQNSGITTFNGLEKVKHIEQYAFANIPAREVIFQPKTQRIDMNAFANSKIEKVTIKDFGKVVSYHDYCMKKLYKSPKTITIIDKGIFSNCNIKEVKIIKTKLKHCIKCFGNISFGKCKNCKTKYKKSK